MKTIALHILDIVQNSIRASATSVGIDIHDSFKTDSLRIIITDNGTGISDEAIENVTDPFFTTRTTRRTGLGIPLFRQHAEMTGGGFSITSVWGEGTAVTAWFIRNHPDRQPIGDIPGILTILIGSNPGISFLYNHKTDSGNYSFSTDETKEILNIDSLNDHCLLCDINEMIKTNLSEIGVNELEYND